MPAKIDLHPSRLDRVFYGLLHGPTLLLLLASIPSQPLFLLLLPLAGILAWHHYRALGDTPLWLMPPTDHQSLQAALRLAEGNLSAALIASTHWQLCDRYGKVNSAKLQATFLYPWFTILDFKLEQGSRRLLLWPDSLSRQSLRQLRRLCSLE